MKRRQVEHHIEKVGHGLKCSFCGKPWHKVERIVTKDEVGICDACVREFSAMIKESREKTI